MTFLARWRRGRQVVHGTASTLAGHRSKDTADPEYRPAVRVAGFARPLQARNQGEQT